jgi:hypothetical protein
VKATTGNNIESQISGTLKFEARLLRAKGLAPMSPSKKEKAAGALLS